MKNYVLFLLYSFLLIGCGSSNYSGLDTSKGLEGWYEYNSIKRGVKKDDFLKLVTSKDISYLKTYINIYPNEKYKSPVIRQFFKLKNVNLLELDYFNNYIQNVPSDNNILVTNEKNKPQYVSSKEFLDYKMKLYYYDNKSNIQDGQLFKKMYLASKEPNLDYFLSFINTADIIEIKKYLEDPFISVSDMEILSYSKLNRSKIRESYIGAGHRIKNSMLFKKAYSLEEGRYSIRYAEELLKKKIDPKRYKKVYNVSLTPDVDTLKYIHRYATFKDLIDLNKNRDFLFKIDKIDFNQKNDDLLYQKYVDIGKKEKKAAYFREAFSIKSNINDLLNLLQYSNYKEIESSIKLLRDNKSLLKNQIHKIKPLNNSYKEFMDYLIKKDKNILIKIMGNSHNSDLNNNFKTKVYLEYLNTYVKDIKDIPLFISKLKNCQECDMNYYTNRIKKSNYFAKNININNFFRSIEYKYILKNSIPKIHYAKNNDNSYSVLLDYDKTQIGFDFKMNCQFIKQTSSSDYSKYVDKIIYYDNYRCSANSKDIKNISRLEERLVISHLTSNKIKLKTWKIKKYSYEKIISNRKQQKQTDSFCYSLSSESAREACLGNAYSTKSENARNIIQNNCYTLKGQESTALTAVCTQGKTGCYSFKNNKVVDSCITCNGSNMWLRTYAAGSLISCY